ncbi:hypothetical protein [Pseudochelatococcus lubricantis]|uniref:hypothetical protein n=1 Tax=Pseudochelatococcus lubricantis TaxID=1538102 RepID=UPI00366CDDC0
MTASGWGILAAIFAQTSIFAPIFALKNPYISMTTPRQPRMPRFLYTLKGKWIRVRLVFVSL